MRVRTWTTYIIINLMRTSDIVRRTDDEDTDVRQLGIILHLTLKDRISQGQGICQ